MDGFSKKFHFKDIGRQEKIIKVLHRNWFYLFQQYLILVVAAFMLSGAFILLPNLYPDFIADIDQSVIAFIENFFMLAIWIYGFMIWIDYYYDIWIITSERIINIEQKGMFTRKASELRFRKIQDVTTEVVGFFPTIINYGDVKIQTAGEQNEFIFRTISDPYAIKNIIMELQKQSEGHIGEEIEDMIRKKMGK